MTTDTPAATVPEKPSPASSRIGARNILSQLGNRRVLVMLFLGFASGLPFMLVGNTLGYWLRESGVALSTIGFLSWVGIAYSMKFFWAPVLDSTRAPLFGWLGRRRGWIVLAQLAVAAGLIGMAIVGPQSLGLFAAFALLCAFASSTQDIAVDAWRIESAADGDELALLSATYQLGYRAALLVTDALILIVAAGIGWKLSYGAMAAAMAIGIAASLAAREPPGETLITGVAGRPPGIRRALDAIAGPFISFFQRHGRFAIVMLAAISLYRLADFVMGPMANPFYSDLGLAKETVGSVRATVGLAGTIAGIAAAGLAALRFGLVPTLLIGAIVGPGSNLGFTWLAIAGAEPWRFALVMAIDNFSQGFAGVALVAYMSSLTSIGYTATQYALLSSFYALLGKFLKGTSGQIVEQLQGNFGAMPGFAWFFAGTALLAIPALALCIWLAVHLPTPAAQARTGGTKAI